jgi:hypothetical protein
MACNRNYNMVLLRLLDKLSDTLLPVNVLNRGPPGRYLNIKKSDHELS